MTITASGTNSGTMSGTTIISSRTFDHRTSSTHRGGPASRYRRVERARVAGPADEPNYAARRLGALVVALGSVVVMAALLNSMLVGLGGSPASAAEAAPVVSGAGRRARRAHFGDPRGATGRFAVVDRRRTPWAGRARSLRRRVDRAERIDRDRGRTGRPAALTAGTSGVTLDACNAHRAVTTTARSSIRAWRRTGPRSDGAVSASAVRTASPRSSASITPR